MLSGFLLQYTKMRINFVNGCHKFSEIVVEIGLFRGFFSLV